MTSQDAVAVNATGVPAPTLAATVAGVTRRFGERVSVDNVDCEIRRGEILAVLGDNGSGKSTLLNIVAGRDLADEGSVTFVTRHGDRLPLAPGSRRAAMRAGIGMVRRQRTLAGSLTALQNIMLGRQSLWRLRLSRAAARTRIAELMRQLSLRFPLDVPVSTLTAGDRLRVEVVRALYGDVELLLIDEPGADLSQQESEALFQGLRTIAAEGRAVVFTTSKVEVALAFADRMLVMRNGKKLHESATAGQDRATIADLVTGRSTVKPPPRYHAGGDTLLEFRKVDARGRDARSSLHQVSFELRGGETLGIAGITGNGQDTLAAIVCGLAPPTGGEILLYGRKLRQFDAGAFVRAGIGRIPADSRRNGVIADLSIEENIALEDFESDWFQRRGLLRRAAIGAHAGEIIKNHGLDFSNPKQAAAGLSLASVQKLVFARVYERLPQLIVACDPTHDIDAGNAQTIHRLLAEARDDNAGILLISEDIDELLMLSDSIAVLYQGRLTLPQPTGAFDAGSLGHMMGGAGSLAQDWSGWSDT